jgi:hypothetical protein
MCSTSSPSQHLSLPVKGLQDEDGAKLVMQLFGSSVHSYYTCRMNNCCTLSRVDIERFKGKSDRFRHEWMFSKDVSFEDKVGMWWLIYEEAVGMYCLLCRKHKEHNQQNKSEKFVADPSVRLKRSAVTDHAQTSVHKRSIEAELQQQRGSCLHKELEKKQSAHFSSVLKAFQSAYFLAREHIANRKLVPLLNFIEHLGMEEIAYFEHRSQGSTRDVFLTIGEIIQDTITGKIRRSGSFGVLIDDVTDAAAMEQMITFAQFLDVDTGKVDVAFLGVRNVLEHHESANAEALYRVFLQLLDDCQLKPSDVKGLCSDGASVMLGKRNGFAAKLQMTPGCRDVVVVHCVCHRLALACCDTSAELSNIKAVEDTLMQLWKWMSYSPKRTAVFLKCQLGIKGIAEPSTANGAKKVCKKLKKACHTRWLSFDAAVKAVYEDFWAVLQTLSAFEKCAVATGLLKKMKTVHFLGIILILKNVLPHLAGLSKVFQSDTVNFSRIQPEIQHVKDKLQQIADEGKPVSQLKADLDPEEGRLKHTGLKISDSEVDRKQRLCSQYVLALCKNIDERFQDSLPVLGAFSLFDPEAVPAPDTPQFKLYGDENVKILADHYFQESENSPVQSERLLSEWSKFKYDLYFNFRQQLPDLEGKQTPTQWCLERLIGMTSAFGYVYPLLVDIAKAALVLPVSNAWPERGASRTKLVKTRLRTRLTGQMLNSLLTISINGPDVTSPECDKMLTQAVEAWLHKKKRHTSKKLQHKQKQQQQQKLRRLQAAYQSEPLTEIADDTEAELSEENEVQLSHLLEMENAEIAAAASAANVSDDGCNSESDSEFSDSSESDDEFNMMSRCWY